MSKAKNQAYLTIFCVIVGVMARGVIWTFLKVMSLGITFLWIFLAAAVGSAIFNHVKESDAE